MEEARAVGLRGWVARCRHVSSEQLGRAVFALAPAALAFHGPLGGGAGATGRQKPRHQLTGGLPVRHSVCASPATELGKPWRVAPALTKPCTTLRPPHKPEARLKPGQL